MTKYAVNIFIVPEGAAKTKMLGGTTESVTVTVMASAPSHARELALAHFDDTLGKVLTRYKQLHGFAPEQVATARIVEEMPR